MKSVLKKCSKFTGEHLCTVMHTQNAHPPMHTQRCSLVNLLYIFVTLFSKNTSGCLLMKEAYENKKDRGKLLGRLYRINHLTALVTATEK